MCEHSRISSAAALREARRRKILENSSKRLKLIEGVNSSASVKNFAEISLEPDGETEIKKTQSKSILDEGYFNAEINSTLSDIVSKKKEFKEISDILTRDQDKVFQSELEEEIVTPGLIKQRKNDFFRICLQKRLHYILLALTVNILFFFDAGYLFFENIFCPFYTVKAIELLSKREEREDFQPIQILLIAGLPKSVQKLTKFILTILLLLFSDLCLYLFIFVIGTKIINNQQ